MVLPYLRLMNFKFEFYCLEYFVQKFYMLKENLIVKCGVLLINHKRQNFRDNTYLMSFDNSNKKN